MKLGNYEVTINQGEEIDDGYVLLEHNKKYSITLKNNSFENCDAQISIDGIHVGTFRINSKSSSTIERPSSDTGYFTFLKFESDEAIQADLQKNECLGLVSVLFKPEKIIKPKKIEPSNIQQCSANSPSYLDLDDSEVSAGGTGLSGTSDQEFQSVPQLDYDEE